MSQAMDQLQSVRQNSNEIYLVPFAKVDGNWNLSDELILKVWEKLAEQNLVKTVFHDDSITNAAEFMSMVKNESNVCVFALSPDDALGLAWVNEIAQNRGFGHFCMFKETWGWQSVDIGRKVLHHWFSLNVDGNPVFKVILGNTPPTNKMALGFIKRLGFTILGEIPHIGVLSYKENLGNGQRT